MANVLWIGFGKMGEPMAARVKAAGHAVTVFDTSDERIALATSQGMTIVRDIHAAAAASDVIVTSLPNDEIAIRALAAEDSPLALIKQDGVLIETSTISVIASRSIAAKAAVHDIAYVRAPISGSVNAAASGKLTSFVSGTDSAIAQARPVVEAYSALMVPVGNEEQARTMKLAVNLMVTTLMVSLSEAFAMCRKADIDPKVALDAICSSAIGSPHLTFKAKALAEDNFVPTFTVTQIRKDTRLILDGARDLGVPLLLGAAVDQVMTAADAMGLSGEDYIACAKVIAELSGLSPVTRTSQE